MGQKVNPNALRFGVYEEWNSMWFNDKEYSKIIVEDNKLRQFIFKKFGKKYDICQIKIKRLANLIKFELLTSKPGIILGNEGKGLKQLYADIKKFLVRYHRFETNKKKLNKIEIRIVEISNLYLNAQWIANKIARRIENREPYRIVQKVSINNALRAGVKGIKTQISGRLNGVDIARSEGYTRGKLPLNTLRSKIQYATATAKTTYGVIGVKVWLCLGENS